MMYQVTSTAWHHIRQHKRQSRLGCAAQLEEATWPDDGRPTMVVHFYEIQWIKFLGAGMGRAKVPWVSMVATRLYCGTDSACWASDVWLPFPTSAR